MDWRIHGMKQILGVSAGIMICVAFIFSFFREELALKGAFDRKGIVLEVNEHAGKILVDAPDKGEIWIRVSLPISFKKGQEVLVWLENEGPDSLPAQGRARYVEVVDAEKQ
jgi:hypothetical protein